MKKRNHFDTSRSDVAPRRLRAVFFGAAAFAVPSLRALAGEHGVAAVVTQPDRPAGRGLHLTPVPVKSAALAARLNVLEPERLDASFVGVIAQLRPELLACAAYGKIIPAALLDVASMAALNVHPSLLPEYRGATPIQAALRDGRDKTGVTVFWMASKMDAGDIALAREVPIAQSDDYGALHDRLAGVGAELLVEAAALLLAGTLPRIPQDHGRATFTKSLSRDELQLDFNLPARSLVNFVRAYAPEPGAWTLLNGKRLKVLWARAEHPVSKRSPGEIVALDGDGPLVACRDGAVRFMRVVPQGKPSMSGAAFVRGHAPLR